MKVKTQVMLYSSWQRSVMCTLDSTLDAGVGGVERARAREVSYSMALLWQFIKCLRALLFDAYILANHQDFDGLFSP